MARRRSAAGARWRSATGGRSYCSAPRPAAPTSCASTPPPASASRSPAIRSTAPGGGRCCSTLCRSGWSATARSRSRRPRRCRRPSSMRASAMSASDPPPIPEDALEEKFLASTGPGGQNVNKVATAVQLRCDVFKLGLEPAVYARLKVLAGSRMTNEGEIIITARKYRTQEANRAEARQRLTELIAKAHIAKPKRIRTKVSRAAKAKRVEGKKQRSAVKQARSRPSLD